MPGAPRMNSPAASPTTVSSASPKPPLISASTPMTIRNMLKDGRLTAWTLGPRVLRIRLSDLDSALSPYGGVHAAT